MYQIVMVVLFTSTFSHLRRETVFGIVLDLLTESVSLLNIADKDKDMLGDKTNDGFRIK